MQVVKSQGRAPSAADLKTAGLQLLDAAYRAAQNDLDVQVRRLSEAARALWTAYRRGAKDPEVVWPLKQLWTDTGHLGQVVDLLTDYLGTADAPEERFLAGHYIVDTYALMGADREAVEHHRRCMAELAPQVSPAMALEHFSDSTMMGCWVRTGQLDDWLMIGSALDDVVDGDDAHSRLAKAYYLRTLAEIWEQQGAIGEAISCAERIIEIYQGDDSPDALRLTGDALAELIQVYAKSGSMEDLERAMRTAFRLVHRIERLRLDPDYARAGGITCHDLACALMWAGHHQRAIPLFEKALSFRESPLTRFFYAGVLLAGRGDRAGALENLRRSSLDPRSSLVHRFEEAFRQNECFAAVHDAPDFLAVVREGVNRYKSLGDRVDRTH